MAPGAGAVRRHDAHGPQALLAQSVQIRGQVWSSLAECESAAAHRRASPKQGGFNKLEEAASKPLWHLVLEQLGDVMGKVRSLPFTGVLLQL